MRTCGDCIVCCVYLRIESPELNKNAMTHCPHLKLPGPVKENMAYYNGQSCKGNCKVHGTDSMPECCSGYSCTWLQGYGDEDDRPDKSLILFDEVHKIENALEAKPLRNEQELTPRSEALFKKMSKETNKTVIVTNFYERQIRRVVGKPIEDK